MVSVRGDLKDGKTMAELVQRSRMVYNSDKSARWVSDTRLLDSYDITVHDNI